MSEARKTSESRVSLPKSPRTAPWGRLHLAVIREDLENTLELLKTTDVNIPTRVRVPSFSFPSFTKEVIAIAIVIATFGLDVATDFRCPLSLHPKSDGTCCLLACHLPL